MPNSKDVPSISQFQAQNNFVTHEINFVTHIYIWRCDMNLSIFCFLLYVMRYPIVARSFVSET